jgi:hypothetical protein
MIHGSKRDEVTGKWGRLHHEEMDDLCCSPNMIRVITSRRVREARHVVRVGEMRGAYRTLVGRPRRRCGNNIKMDLQEVR